MNGIFENPIPVLFVGTVIFAIFFAIWTQLRKRSWMLAAIAAALLTLGGLVLERVVVTEAERVATTIHGIAEDMESNDLQAVLRHISESSPDLRRYAESILSRVKLESVSVKRNLSVTVIDHGTYKTATAKFNAVARVEDKSGTFGRQNVPRFVILQLRQDDTGWRVTDYEAKMPQEGFGQ